jgi:hypothetical protein
MSDVESIIDVYFRHSNQHQITETEVIIHKI